MRIALTLILSFVFAGLVCAQGVSSQVEANFDRNIRKYKHRRFDMGEDATSGFTYHVYTEKSRVVKIRAIWNGGAQNVPTVDDFYFEGKQSTPVLYVKRSINRRGVNSVIDGSNRSLAALEKLYFKDWKLIKWLEKGKVVPKGDARWTNRESDILEDAKSQLRNYVEMKEEN